MLTILLYGGRIQDCDRETNKPDPEHLKDPEAKEGKEFIALIIEAVVFACFQDSEEQEATETCAPKHDEEGDDDVAGERMAIEG